MSANYPITKGQLVRLLTVFLVSFAVVMTILNAQAITKQAEFIMNKFSNQDEIAETEYLLNFYHNLEDKKRSLIPVEAEENLIAENSIFIPKTNTRAPIILAKSENTQDILEDLKNGVVLYPDSSSPGQGGTTSILGHSSSNYPWNEYSNIFSLLYKLEAGDLIYLKYEGDFFVYQVSKRMTGSVFTLAKADLGGDLILSSCWPVGTDQGRIIIVANLVQ